MTVSALPALDHERVTSVTGARSGLPVIVAVHSTALGPALGGCRMWAYPSWADGLADALRLSSAMTLKCAAAGLDIGGGKSVIVLPEAGTLSDARRRSALLDLGDVVESLGGIYRTAEDVGTSTADMLVVRERTSHVVGMPHDQGGLGEPAEPTAAGVYAAITVTAGRLGLPLGGLRVTIAGLGQVGTRLARRLARDGAALTVSDINAQRRVLAEELGAVWVSPSRVLGVPSDIVVPAGVGGVLTRQSIGELDTRAVVGPANNQLADPGNDELLAARGVLWAPDFIVNAGGALGAILTEVDKLDPASVAARVSAIGSTLASVYDLADEQHVTPLQAARQMAAERLPRTEPAA